ncbi:Flp family type IVb pilin [Sphingomonas sp. LaA6.9]|uniref:Flp family type IVb pilin n=1 Tax=Sphingomonas sp. LaA6.9 TaxID=2919914 RepID=UPI001F4F36DA|nr:Flp family type IVb pilin [Sphingomonas sp. LaA6.9]MCJ8157618.1 Flp family type IVb pilin [Sphingomonas sp. LaA6.9]
MKRILEKFASLTADSGAATAVEYSLIASLIVIAMIGALNALTARTSEMWQFVADVSNSVM